MQSSLFSWQVNEILDVPTIGGSIDDEINASPYQINAALDTQGSKAVTAQAGLQLPTMTVAAGTDPATSANTGLSINDFNTFRKRFATALNTIENKIDSILNITSLDCHVCN